MSGGELRMGAQERIGGPGVQSQYCSATRPRPVCCTSGRASVSPSVSRKDGSGWISSGAESVSGESRERAGVWEGLGRGKDLALLDCMNV